MFNFNNSQFMTHSSQLILALKHFSIEALLLKGLKD